VGGDAYVLSHVISNSDEDQSVTVLGHCRRAMNGVRFLTCPGMSHSGREQRLLSQHRFSKHGR
jgi:hypothetical protein